MRLNEIMYCFLSIQMFLRSKDNFEGVLFLAFNNEGSVSTNSAFSFRSNSEGVEKLRDDKNRSHRPCVVATKRSTFNILFS